MIEVRFATPADAPVIVELAHKTWKATYSAIYPIDYIEDCLTKWYSLETVTRGCCPPRKNWHGYLIAEKEGRIVGYLGAGIEEEVGFIYNFYVLPEYQGQGIGQLLLKNITKFQIEQYGIRYQQLSVAKDNLPAISFYQHQGFQPLTEKENEFAGQPIHQIICQRTIQ